MTNASPRDRVSVPTQKIRRLALVALALGVCLPSAAAQGTRADYERAAALDETWGSALVTFRPGITWLSKEEGGGLVWKGADGEYIVVDGEGKRRRSDDPAELGISGELDTLQPLPMYERSGSGGAETLIEFKNEFDRPVQLLWVDRSSRMRDYGQVEAGATRSLSTYAGHFWVVRFPKGDRCGVFVAKPWAASAVVGEESYRIANESRVSREPEDVGAELSWSMDLDHDVLAVEHTDGRRVVLATAVADGPAPSESQSYHLRGESPSGRYYLAFLKDEPERRKIPLLASSPDGPRGAVQPSLKWIPYAKPGDPVTQRYPRIVDIEKQALVPVDDSFFEDTYNVRLQHWMPDGQSVLILVHFRGNHRHCLIKLDLSTGQRTTIIEENPGAFFDYSQKFMLRVLDERRELLWASERDGWNHLYRIDMSSGEVLDQITRGPWVVRGVERVDEEAGQIWFTAMGIRPDEDPYDRHLARVNWDGSGLVVLTEGDGTHEWTFNSDFTLFTDRWSRVDQPAVTELRRASDGKKLAELGRDDATALKEAGFRFPERFVAKGRDGTTDIHGIILRPSNFEPGRRYPVIESIYAGPHDFHVPKRFGLGLRERRLAELGFIVVQIDGMGTNWRSKAFHEVCWKNLKDAGFPDRVAWMRAAAEVYPEFDIERVGIFGGSAGGQNALGALLHHGDFYDAAAADCGCHDNRMDKIWWNEAWMGKLGPHYAESSNVTHAGRLKGKLLLTVGELDRNVDPASTYQVVDSLIRANKDFDFVMVPGAGHGVGERPYLARRRQDFFVRALHGVEPRRPD